MRGGTGADIGFGSGVYVGVGVVYVSCVQVGAEVGVGAVYVHVEV